MDYFSPNTDRELYRACLQAAATTLSTEKINHVVLELCDYDQRDQQIANYAWRLYYCVAGDGTP